jgi:Na+-translocating ferredoxin:NAD+ oxidoreductase RnfG subunit
MSCGSEWGLSSRLVQALIAIGGAALWAAAPLGAAVFSSQSEALATAFPGAERLERRSFVLTDAQTEEVQELARAPLPSRIVTLHVAWRGDELLGYALIDVHTVRTMPEALMVVLSPDGVVRSLRVLAFHEPPEYLPTDAWREQFEGRKLADDLQLRRGIDAISGATLSSRAATRTVRLALALHRVLIGAETGQGE